ncbi:MAG: hypothetical protein RJA77_1148, partial [Pseudomonadota bacterium]
MIEIRSLCKHYRRGDQDVVVLQNLDL